MKVKNFKLAALMILLGSQTLLADQETEQENDIAKKLANPLAAMISLPFQLNYNQNFGLNDEGEQWKLNVQPVIPMEFNDDWNIITRTVIPVISQKDFYPGMGTQDGIGDIVFKAWFSPKTTAADGWIWGVGPVFLIPTNSDVSARKWGVGPTAIALKQEGRITYGGLANHIWSTGGSDAVVEDISTTFVQPFVSYITPQAITVALTTETTYDWENEQWSVPVYVNVSKVEKIGDQIVSFGAGVNYWAESPDGGPEGWGARFVLTFIFPK